MNHWKENVNTYAVRMCGENDRAAEQRGSQPDSVGTPLEQHAELEPHEITQLLLFLWGVAAISCSSFTGTQFCAYSAFVFFLM